LGHRCCGFGKAAKEAERLGIAVKRAVLILAY
jgi:hypothetical protein